MPGPALWRSGPAVALRKESVDRNIHAVNLACKMSVALRKESVDRNIRREMSLIRPYASLSARRAWIEIAMGTSLLRCSCVALRKESVDRNQMEPDIIPICVRSLSARRAWIEIQRG